VTVSRKPELPRLPPATPCPSTWETWGPFRGHGLYWTPAESQHAGCVPGSSGLPGEAKPSVWMAPQREQEGRQALCRVPSLPGGQVHAGLRGGPTWTWLFLRGAWRPLSLINILPKSDLEGIS